MCAAAATLREAAAASPPAFAPESLPATRAGAWPRLLRGLAELAVGMAECQAALRTSTMPDGLERPLFGGESGPLRSVLELSDSGRIPMTCMVRPLPPGTIDRFLERGRAALARGAECLRALKPWLQPHKLAREKAALRALQAALEDAVRAAPAQGEEWRAWRAVPGWR